MAAGGLIAQPLGANGGFNWVFLIELILCGILAIFYLFYFNRVFATIISFGIRAYTWHKYKATVDFTSLQISLLGGRFFFKSLKYQAHNETILVHDGRITWRYWLRRVQEADVYRTTTLADEDPVGSGSSNEGYSNEKRRTADQETARVPAQTSLPCRLHIRVSGVEAFLYNHSPSYDHLMSEFEAAQKQTSSNANAGSSDVDGANDDDVDLTTEKTATTTTNPLDQSSRIASTRPLSSSPSRAEGDKYSGPQLPAFLKMFPVYVECKKAAVAVGNENTTSIIVAKTQWAEGRIDAAKAGPLDVFKLLFDFKADNVNIALRQNHDYKEPQLAAAVRPDEDTDVKKIHRLQPRTALGARMLRFLSSCVRKLPWMQSDTASVLASSLHGHSDFSDQHIPLVAVEPWHGLARYLSDDDGHAGKEWESVEYARLSSLADFDTLGFKFYWDIAGEVPPDNEGSFVSPTITQSNDANGSNPPDYGLEVTFGNGIVNYGPWTDRERAVLQAVFFPASMVDSRPLARIRPGQSRIATVFHMTYIIDGSVTLRIPTREATKDWRHQSADPATGLQSTATGLRQRGQASHIKNKQSKSYSTSVPKDKRPFGWMDITVFKDTVVHYDMDMYARSDGYHNRLSVQVKTPQIATSVNHDILWRSGDISVHGDLSNPLGWDALRTWTFNITCDNLDLFILRDHMFLLTDLITDWSSGAGSEYHTFVPYKYVLSADFHDFNLILGANDANIINRTTDFDDNNFLMLKGHLLHLDFLIPQESFRPKSSVFTFDVYTKDLTLDLHNPPRLTLNELLQPKTIGKLPKLTLKGSMFSNAAQSPDLTDILQMEICGTELDLVVHGYLLRYFINVKENYFGRFLHFRTFEEYQASYGDVTTSVREQIEKYKYRRSNDLDVILSIIVERPVLKFPSNIFAADNYVKAELPVANVDLRVTNYYLDLQVDVCPVSFYHVLQGDDGPECSPPQLRIESVTVAGHRLFGLPPAEPAYVSTWDIDTGLISGNSSPEFLNQAVKSGMALGFSFSDSENALPDSEAIEVNDMVFVAVRTSDVSLSLDIADTVLSLEFAPLALSFDDKADANFSSRLSTRIPDLQVTCRRADGNMYHHASHEHSAGTKTLFYMHSTIDLTMVTRKQAFQQYKHAQQRHVVKHDARTERASFVKHSTTDTMSWDSDDVPSTEPAMYAPDLPEPAVLPADITRTAAARMSTWQVGERPANRIKHKDKDTAQIMSAYFDSHPINLEKEVDLTDVPSLPIHEPSTAYDTIQPLSAKRPQTSTGDRDYAQKSLAIRFTPGITAIMRPEFLEVTSQLANAFTASSDKDVMDDLLMSIVALVQDAGAVRKGKTNLFNVHLVVPSLHLRTVIETVATKSDTLCKHYLELTLDRLTTALRLSNIIENDSLRNAVVLHTSLDSLAMELITNVASRTSSVPDLHFEVEEILTWANLAEVHSVDVSFRVLGLAISDQGLTDTTTAVIKIVEKIMALASGLSRMESTKDYRTQQLLLFLSQAHDGAPDPMYVTRMTHALRTFPDHLRNQESWKMLARIRHVHATLSQEQRDQLEKVMTVSRDSRPTKASESLNEMLSWCAWDIPAPQDTALYTYLFPQPDEVEDAMRRTPLQLSIKSGLVRVNVGATSRGSEASIADLAIEVDLKPPSEPTGLMLMEDNIRTLVSVLTHSSAVFLRLKWDLVDAMMPVLDAVKESGIMLTERPARKPSMHRLSTWDFPPLRNDFHVFFSTDDGTIMLDTINLQHVSAVRKLQLSLIGTSQASKLYTNALSALVSAELASTELLKRGTAYQRFWRTNLSGPSIYVDMRQRRSQTTKEINVGGMYDEMMVVVEQEPIEILATVERIIADEVAQARIIQDRIASLSPQAVATAETPMAPPASGLFEDIEINIALLAGTFDLSVLVLQSLIINVKGDIANLRVKPRGSTYSKLGIEIEVGTMRYSALNREARLVGEDTQLDTPASQTSVELDLSPESNYVRIKSNFEELVVEALTVQNLVSLLRRPELAEVGKALKNGITSIKQTIARVGGDDKPSSKSQPLSSLALQYCLDMDFAGLRVTATAPVQDKRHDSAKLAWGISAVHCTLSNKDRGQGLIPDVFAQIGSIYGTLDLVRGATVSPCGHIKVGLALQTRRSPQADQSVTGDILIVSDGLDIEVHSATASSIVDIITHVQRKLVNIDLSKELEYLRKFKPLQRRATFAQLTSQPSEDDTAIDPISCYAPSTLVITLNRIRLAWITAPPQRKQRDWHTEDLELSLAQVHFSLRQFHLAQLKIDSLMLQITPKTAQHSQRSANSALLPELLFTVRCKRQSDGLHLALQSAGEALDVRLNSDFAGPLGHLIMSITAAIDKYHEAAAHWQSESPTEGTKSRQNPFGGVRLASLLVDLSFDGILVHLHGKAALAVPDGDHIKLINVTSGRGKDIAEAQFKAPGIGIKLEYLAEGSESAEGSLTGEVKIDASNNTLQPEVVPILLQMSEHAKLAMQTSDAAGAQQRQEAKEIKAQSQPRRNTVIALPDENLLASNELLAKTRISIGIRVQEQQFGLSCQPFAKVNAKAQFDEIYISFNTCDPPSGSRFVAVTSTLTGLAASVQHIYSRESTFSFEMQSVTLSAANCKADDESLSSISAIVQVAPMKTVVNARQVQDLLLFREIWFPEQMRPTPPPPTTAPAQEVNADFLIERYRQVASVAAFPWNVTVALSEINLDIDFGSSIGKSSIDITNAWVTSTKSSDYKQELCVGVDKVAARSVGRMGGAIDIGNLRLRTHIEWPLEQMEMQKTPLIQATVGFEFLKVKAAFDFQPFAFAELTKLSFIMFNVRDKDDRSTDRLVADMDLGNVYAYFVATSPAQAFGLYQAFDRLITEKQTAFHQSVADLQKQLRRPSVIPPGTVRNVQPFINAASERKKTDVQNVRLRTDVLVGIRSVHLGVFPGTFFDGQILKLETTDGQARFMVDVQDGKIHSNLSLVLGQLQVALASATRVQVPRNLGEIPLEEVIQNGALAKGGIILRVPRLVAAMQTWQVPEARTIEYIFKSTFEGKVDVGWNYSRISFIRTMWTTHTRSLAARLGRQLPASAVKITTGAQPHEEEGGDKEQEKITAVVNMPLSRYEYQALEPPVIETPQLRDMGEATPPLEWIGLQRERLPNVVHQVVIVSLLELADKVEEAYGSILGRS